MILFFFPGFFLGGGKWAWGFVNPSNFSLLTQSLSIQYIVSGSDEMCLRLWKARASEKLGIIKDRERVSLQYKEKLKEKYAQHPQVIVLEIFQFARILKVGYSILYALFNNWGLKI